MKQLGDNIRREQEHRDKVFEKYKNNGKRVKEMIQDFERQVPVDADDGKFGHALLEQLGKSVPKSAR